MPISAISAASRSRPPGSASCCRRCCINYFGQGALVLADPEAIENPFYRLVPEMLLLPMVVLATAATVIASQAVITGAYSLTIRRSSSACCRGSRSCTPRRRISGRSTSRASTRSLLVGVLLLVGLFRTSSALALAYGIAVTTTMVVDGAARLHRDLEAVEMELVAARRC